VIPLPVRMPQKAMEHLEALAEPGDLAAAEAAAERALDACRTRSTAGRRSRPGSNGSCRRRRRRP